MMYRKFTTTGKKLKKNKRVVGNYPFLIHFRGWTLLCKNLIQ